MANEVEDGVIEKHKDEVDHWSVSINKTKGTINIYGPGAEGGASVPMVANLKLPIFEAPNGVSSLEPMTQVCVIVSAYNPDTP